MMKREKKKKKIREFKEKGNQNKILWPKGDHNNSRAGDS